MASIRPKLKLKTGEVPKPQRTEVTRGQAQEVDPKIKKKMLEAMALYQLKQKNEGLGDKPEKIAKDKPYWVVDKKKGSKIKRFK